jgi:hypothetical protein
MYRPSIGDEVQWVAKGGKVLASGIVLEDYGCDSPRPYLVHITESFQARAVQRESVCGTRCRLASDNVRLRNVKPGTPQLSYWREHPLMLAHCCIDARSFQGPRCVHFVTEADVKACSHWSCCGLDRWESMCAIDGSVHRFLGLDSAVRSSSSRSLYHCGQVVEVGGQTIVCGPKVGPQCRSCERFQSSLHGSVHAAVLGTLVTMIDDFPASGTCGGPLAPGVIGEVVGLQREYLLVKPVAMTQTWRGDRHRDRCWWYPRDVLRLVEFNGTATGSDTVSRNPPESGPSWDLPQAMARPDRFPTTGDFVKLSAGYARFQDAVVAPLREGDVGLILIDDGGTDRRYAVQLVQDSDRPLRENHPRDMPQVWWYHADAVELVDSCAEQPPKPTWRDNISGSFCSREYCPNGSHCLHGVVDIEVPHWSCCGATEKTMPCVHHGCNHGCTTGSSCPDREPQCNACIERQRNAWLAVGRGDWIWSALADELESMQLFDKLVPLAKDGHGAISNGCCYHHTASAASTNFHNPV